MENQPTGGPTAFDLEPLPPDLWPMERLRRELQADEQTIRRWVREGRLAPPCLRRGGQAYWSPSDVEPFRDRRLRRLSVN